MEAKVITVTISNITHKDSINTLNMHASHKRQQWSHITENTTEPYCLTEKLTSQHVHNAPVMLTILWIKLRLLTIPTQHALDF